MMHILSIRPNNVNYSLRPVSIYMAGKLIKKAVTTSTEQNNEDRSDRSDEVVVQRKKTNSEFYVGIEFNTD